MPNWSTTDYFVIGSTKEIMDLNKKMEKLENRKKSLVKNGFGNTWLGNLVQYLSGFFIFIEEVSTYFILNSYFILLYSEL